jgi:hypothetical protein
MSGAVWRSDCWHGAPIRHHGLAQWYVEVIGGTLATICTSHRLRKMVPRRLERTERIVLSGCHVYVYPEEREVQGWNKTTTHRTHRTRRVRVPSEPGLRACQSACYACYVWWVCSKFPGVCLQVTWKPWFGVVAWDRGTVSGDVTYHVYVRVLHDGHVNVYVCTHKWMHVHVYVCTYVCMYVRPRVCICTKTYMWRYITHTQTDTHIHTHSHTHVYMHTQTNMHTQSQSSCSNPLKNTYKQSRCSKSGTSRASSTRTYTRRMVTIRYKPS